MSASRLLRCVAVVGPGEGATAEAVADAEAVGRLMAERGWVTLTGGRAAGVMAAAASGATAAGGLAIGVLPGADLRDAASELTIALATGLGEARNAVLVTAAAAVIGCGVNPGTVSELALALRAGKPTALVGASAAVVAFFAALAAGAPFAAVATPAEAVDWVALALGDVSPRAPTNAT
jgi:uncharacterized protein (TIGR00725 family)